MVHTQWRGPGDRVLLITLDRPERRNALDHDTLDRLGAALDQATRGEARAVVLTGAHGVFCAGADLTGVEDEAFAAVLRGVLTGFGRLPCATIAAVEGPALGAGTQLAVACDLRVATADARFGIPAARLGLMVDQWTVQRLSLFAGHAPARAMLLAAEVLSGADALRLGLVQRPGGLAEALAWADEITGYAPLTVAGHKLALERLSAPGEPDPELSAAITTAWSSADKEEGVAAFREKRAPRFEGR